MLTLNFITGGGMTPQQADALAASITSYYQAHISGVTFTVTAYKYTDDIHGQIAASQPTGPLIICGHSFGGAEAVKTAAKFAAEGRAVDHLFVFDPVDDTGQNYATPNTVGFTLTPNVLDAVCFYRGATEAPFSGQITTGKSFKNILFPADGSGGSAAHHGDSVWDMTCIAYVAAALKSAAVAPTPPVTPVVPPARTIKTVTLLFSDGTSVTYP